MLHITQHSPQKHYLFLEFLHECVWKKMLGTYMKQYDDK